MILLQAGRVSQNLLINKLHGYTIHQ